MVEGGYEETIHLYDRILIGFISRKTKHGMCAIRIRNFTVREGGELEMIFYSLILKVEKLKIFQICFLTKDIIISLEYFKIFLPKARHPCRKKSTNVSREYKLLLAATTD